jgi:hypothetical protein
MSAVSALEAQYGPSKWLSSIKDLLSNRASSRVRANSANWGTQLRPARRNSKSLGADGDVLGHGIERSAAAGVRGRAPRSPACRSGTDSARRTCGDHHLFTQGIHPADSVVPRHPNVRKGTSSAAVAQAGECVARRLFPLGDKPVLRYAAAWLSGKRPFLTRRSDFGV